MPRTREEMTAAQVKALMATVGQEPFDEYVGGVAGLSLRARSQGASWVLRGRVKGVPTVRTWTIGDGQSVSLATARARAALALDRARDGIDPAAWLAEQQGKPPPQKASPPPQKASPDGWVWEHAVSRYLELCAPTWREATLNGHRWNLLHPAVVAALGGRALRDISADDLSRLQNAFLDQGKRSMAKAVAMSISGMLRWCAGRPEAGLPRRYLRDLLDDVSRIRLPKADTRSPTAKALGEPPWRLGGESFTPRMRHAVMLLALTSQRVRTVRETETEHFLDGVWDIPPHLMKGNRPHRIPLPPLAAACAEALRAMAGDSKWLLPQAGGRGPLTYKPVRQAVSAALPGHSPHGLRYAFVSHGRAALRLLLEQVQITIAHSHGGVTERYSLIELGEIAGESLMTWERWLVARMLASRPPGAPEWPTWLPRPPEYD